MPEKNTSLTKKTLTKALDWAYDKAITHTPGLDSAQELAESYLAKADSPEQAARSLVRWQITKAGSAGFLTGFGGLLFMPVTIPANLASVLYIQIRMAAAIAHMAGLDLRDDKVKTFVLGCLAGNSIKEIAKEAGIVIGSQFAKQAIKQISGKTLVAINQKVGFRLLTKFGEKGAINLGKAVPFLGGIIGGAFDSVTTKIVGSVAIQVFLKVDKEPAAEAPVIELDSSELS